VSTRLGAVAMEGYRGTSAAMAEISRDAFIWAGRKTASGAEVRDVTLQQRVVEPIGRAGLVTDHAPIAAFAANSAMPHYEPHAGADLRLQAGQVLLLDLWGGPSLGSVLDRKSVV